MESLYCDVVGAEITKEICDKRKEQAQTFRDKGDPHKSLEKCMSCKKIIDEKKEVAEIGNCERKNCIHYDITFRNDCSIYLDINQCEETVNTDQEDESEIDLICIHCKRPPDAIKSKWIKKRSMHVSCYQTVKRTGQPQEEKILCVICKRPPEALKSVWIKKRQMHHTCYNNQNTRGEPKKPQIKRELKHYSFPENTIDSLMIENIKLKTIIETIDKYAPVADSTCTDPGITFSEAVRRSLIDDKHIVFIEDKY